MCAALDITPVIVESDSMVAVKLLAGKVDNWRLEYTFRECLKLMSSNFKIIHGYRQKNQVTDQLAAFAHARKERIEYFSVANLLREVRRAFIADIHGIS